MGKWVARQTPQRAHIKEHHCWEVALFCCHQNWLLGPGSLGVCKGVCSSWAVFFGVFYGWRLFFSNRKGGSFPLQSDGNHMITIWLVSFCLVCNVPLLHFVTRLTERMSKGEGSATRLGWNGGVGRDGWTPRVDDTICIHAFVTARKIW